MSTLSNLLAPIMLGKTQVKNRVVFTAHMTNFAAADTLSPQHINYYLRRARGGAGLIITEEQSVHANDHPYERMIKAYKPSVVNDYKKLTKTVHRYNTKIFAQINHNGSQGSGIYTGKPLWAPSPLPDPIFKEVPKEMEQEDMAELAASYMQAAGAVQQGGFDGIELQISHSSLIRQFLSPATNLRQDGYGGDLRGRMRLLIEVLHGVREKVGGDFCLGVRLCMDEFIQDGITPEQTIEMAVILEQAGLVDYFNTSLANFHNLFLVEGSMRMPLAYAVYLAASLRREVSLPVIATGRINDPVHAEQLIKDGLTDMVGVVRGQICDPDFVRKSMAEEQDDIRKCIACNQGCAGRMGLNFALGCVQNPYAGAEAEAEAAAKARPTGGLTGKSKKRNAYVIGGGPGGMEAAAVAAENGYRVFLYERSSVAGGQVAVFTRLPGRGEFEELIRNQLHLLKKLRVEMELSREIGVKQLLSWGNEDAVIVLATGAKAAPPPFTVTGRTNVCSVREVLENHIDPGRRILVYDLLGYHPGAAMAELLLDQGKEVFLATPALYVGSGLGPTQDLPLWYRSVMARGLKIFTDVIISEVRDNTVLLMDHYCGKTRTLEGIDMVVFAAPRLPDDSLYFQLKGKVERLYRIGDCLSPRKVENAIKEARDLCNIFH